MEPRCRSRAERGAAHRAGRIEVRGDVTARHASKAATRAEFEDLAAGIWPAVLARAGRAGPARPAPARGGRRRRRAGWWSSRSCSRRRPSACCPDRCCRRCSPACSSASTRAAELRERLLPASSAGATGACATEASGLTATRSSGGWEVSGTTRPVLGARRRRDAASSAPQRADGETIWFVVAGEQRAAVTVTTLRSVDLTRDLGRVTLSGLPRARRGSVLDLDSARLRATAAALFSAEAAGVARWCQTTGWRTPRCGSSSAGRSASVPGDQAQVRAAVRPQRDDRRGRLGRGARLEPGRRAVRAGRGRRRGHLPARRGRHRLWRRSRCSAASATRGSTTPTCTGVGRWRWTPCSGPRGRVGARAGRVAPQDRRHHDMRAGRGARRSARGSRRGWPRRRRCEAERRAYLGRPGLVAPHYPRPYGLGATRWQQIVIAQEFASAGMTQPKTDHRRVGIADDPRARHRRAEEALRRGRRCAARSGGASCSASQGRARTSRRCDQGRAGRRRLAAHRPEDLDLRRPSRPTGGSAWPGPTPRRPSTRALATSWSTCAARASRSGRCARPTAATCSTRSSSTTSSCLTTAWSASPATAGGWPVRRSGTSGSTSPPGWDGAATCPPTS